MSARFLSVLTWAAMIAGCAGASQDPLPGSAVPFMPNGQRYNIATEQRNRDESPLNPIVGVYVSEFYSTQLLNYDDAATGSPLCETGNVPYVQSIQSDIKHDLIVPSINSTGNQGTVYIYKESAHLCLSNLPTASFTEPYGAPSDGFSLDGKTYYVGNSNGVAVCKLSHAVHGCIRELTSPNGNNNIIAVTADAGGVYAVAYNANTSATHLVYWKGAVGNGTILSGYVNRGPGGVYFDAAHNLLAIDSGSQAVYLYTGCPSACTAQGPFPLVGSALYGTLANGNSEFVTMEFGGVIDVYAYHGLYGLQFLFSNSAGLSESLSPLGISQRL